MNDIMTIRSTTRWLLTLLALAATAAQAADPTGSGPERAIVYSDPALPSHTIYRPENLTGTYPIVLWGNGSCINSNFGYREFLAEVASHGMIVLAIGPYRDSAPPRLERPEDPAEWPPFETHYSQMLDALDWITQENDKNESEFHNKVATNRVAAMGHSCGGLQTVKISVDPRITTAVVLNSGMMPDGDQYMARHELERSIISQMHAPIAYFVGGESDIAYENAAADWQQLQEGGVTAIFANMDVGHGGTYQMTNGGPFATGPVAWLKWQLRDDPEAASLFSGSGCGLCSVADWTVNQHFPE